MSKQWILSGLAAGLLVACGTAHGEGGARVSVDASNPAAFARGASKWADTCQRCHAMRDPKEFDDAEWTVITTHMRVRAGLTAEDAADIRTFLQQGN